LLDLFQIKNGKFKKNEAYFDLRESLTMVVDMFSVATQEKKIKLTFECDPDVPQHVVTD
jgi:signal transduction histidine kinase